MLKIHLWKRVIIFGVKYFKEPEKKVWKNKVEYCEKDEQQWPPCGDQGPSRGTLGRGDHVLDGREEKVHIWASSIRDFFSMLAWYFPIYTFESVHYIKRIVFYWQSYFQSCVWYSLRFYWQSYFQSCVWYFLRRYQSASYIQWSGQSVLSWKRQDI